MDEDPKTIPAGGASDEDDQGSGSGGSGSGSEDDMPEGEEKGGDVIPRSGDCPYCDMKFKSVFSLRAHIGHHFRKGEVLRTGKPTYLATKKKRFKGKWSKRPKLERVSCDVCGHWFSSRHALLRHNAVHTGEKPFQCNTCEKRFTTKYSLQIHSNTQHSGKLFEEGTSCSDGGGALPDVASLTKHACEANAATDCSSAALTKSATPKKEPTARSTAAASGKKGGFSCPYCDRVFASHNGLGGHIRAHKAGQIRTDINSPPVERKKVDYSPRKSPTKSITYKELHCTVCSKVFKYKMALKRHIISHSDQPGPFRCPLCPEEYPDTDMLVAHMCTHANSCPVCHETFEYPSFLERHMRSEGHYAPTSPSQERSTDADKQEDHSLVCPSNAGSIDSQSRKQAREKPAPSCTSCENETLRAALKTAPLIKRHDSYDPGEGTSQRHRVSADKNIQPDSSDDKNSKSEVVNGDRESKVKCPICCKKYPKGISFIRHKSWHTRRSEHKKIQARTQPPLKIRIRATQPAELSNLSKCPICYKEYTHSLSMRRHMKYAHGSKSLYLLRNIKVVNSSQDESTVEYSVAQPAEEESSLKRKVSVNSRKNENSSDASKGEIDHFGDSRVGTETSDDNALTVPNVVKRSRTSPTSQRGTFHCPICGQSFTWYSNMRTHMRKSHSNTAPVYPPSQSYSNTVPAYPPPQGHSNIVSAYPPPQSHSNTAPVYPPPQSHSNTAPVYPPPQSHSNTAPVYPPPQTTPNNTDDNEDNAERRFPCNVCGKKFLNTCGLGMHMKSHKDSGSIVYQVESPLKSAVEDQHNCSICGKSFRDEANLKIHIKLHQSTTAVKTGQDGSDRYFCPKCSEGFHYYCRLKRHMEQKHGSGPAAQLKAKGRMRPFYCRFCPRRFTNSGTLRNHEKSHLRRQHEMIAEPTELTFTPSGPDEEFSVSQKETAAMPPLLVNGPANATAKAEASGFFSCTLCSKSFATKGNLTRHTKLVHAAHIPSLRNMLELYNRPSEDPTEVLATQRQTPSDQRYTSIPRERNDGKYRPYSCPVCGKRFTLNWTKTLHIRKFHPGYAKPRAMKNSVAARQQRAPPQPPEISQQQPKAQQQKQKVPQQQQIATQWQNVPHQQRRAPQSRVPQHRSMRYTCRGCHKPYSNHFQLNGHKRHCAAYKRAMLNETDYTSFEIETLNDNQSDQYSRDSGANSYSDYHNTDHESGSYNYVEENTYSASESGKKFSNKSDWSYQGSTNGYCYIDRAPYSHRNIVIADMRKLKQEPKSDTESIDMGFDKYVETDQFSDKVKEQYDEKDDIYHMKKSYQHLTSGDAASKKEVLTQNDNEAVYEGKAAEPIAREDEDMHNEYADEYSDYEEEQEDEQQEEDPDEYTSPLYFKMLSRKGLNQSNALAMIRKSVMNQRMLGESGYVLGSINSPVIHQNGSKSSNVMGYLVGHPNGYGPFMCPICSRRFPSTSIFADHLMFHADRCPDAGLLANVFRPADHPRQSNECDCHLFGLNFQHCPKCVMGYKSLDELKQHVKMHVQNYIEHRLTKIKL